MILLQYVHVIYFCMRSTLYITLCKNCCLYNLPEFFVLNIYERVCCVENVLLGIHIIHVWCASLFLYIIIIKQSSKFSFRMFRQSQKHLNKLTETADLKSCHNTAGNVLKICIFCLTRHPYNC